MKTGGNGMNKGLSIKEKEILDSLLNITEGIYKIFPYSI